MIPFDVAARWRDGERVPGVAFPPGAHVRILEGPFADDCGRVRDLLEIEPESCYRIEVDAAHVEVEVSESGLTTL
jgi:transcription antitermination factor NusG